MTDNEIIKALKHCYTEGYFCYDCPFNRIDKCDDILMSEYVPDLIGRQQEEIENLKIENQSLRSAANSYKLHYNEARVEAFKEFAELLMLLYTDEDITDDMHCPVGVIKENIKDILRELVGDNQ